MAHGKLLSLRTFLAGLILAALTVSTGFAQPQAETRGAAAPAPSAPSKTGAIGVLVVSVVPGSPAEKAGIARGDIILEVSGTAVNDARDLRKAFAGSASGKTVSVKLRHGDVEKALSVTVGSWDGRPWIGILPLPGRGAGMMDDEEFGYGMHGFGMHGPIGPAEGALVEGVAPGSPAEKAGLKQGDVILSVDGTRVDMRHSLGDLVSAKKAGDSITLAVTAEGPDAARDVKVTLEKSPGKDAPFLGVRYTQAHPDFEARFPGHGMMRGAFVIEVAADGPAAKAGIHPRDIVVKVDGAAVADPRQVVNAVKKHAPGDTFAVTVRRTPGGDPVEITVTLGQNPEDKSKAWLGLSMSDGFGPPDMPGRSPKPPSAEDGDAPTL
jgi:S1-C subfamily serine protease